MSYRCDYCGKTQKNGKKPMHIIAQKRRKTYPERKYMVRAGKKFVEVRDKGGSGWEIVKEKLMCEYCWKRDPANQES
jgi:hypothetical protein